MKYLSRQRPHSLLTDMETTWMWDIMNKMAHFVVLLDM